MPPENEADREERIRALTAEKAQAEALVEAYKLLEGQVDELAQAERDLLAASVALIKRNKEPAQPPPKRYRINSSDSVAPLRN